MSYPHNAYPFVWNVVLFLKKRQLAPHFHQLKLLLIHSVFPYGKALGGEGFAMTCDSADRARVDEVVKTAACGMAGE